MGSRCLFVTIVSGNSRVAVPPASTMPFMARKRSSGGCRRRQRSARAGRRTRGRQAGLLALGEGPAAAAGRAIDRLLLDRWETALVIQDHEHELELVEIGGGLEIRGLDDGVRIAPHIDDLADQETLGIGRTDTATQLDTRRDD